ncbi:hypothetical protein jhhlp_002021 [Lomentospora prolificans]|uniref:Nuclear speckle splicing regulatory protein 1 N-terminal domain-containing protein n=1 Tax=Lomentospora prolificans TaxID=41688 RepID=A0A2N3NCW9_9PEZI|nr:hypothetical protein jhhlp_002021 [Lomentospora prolificans]
MSNQGLSLGLRLSKKSSKPAPGKRKAFGGDSESDSDGDSKPSLSTKAAGGAETVVEIGGLDVDDFASSGPAPSPEAGRRSKNKNALASARPPTLKKKSVPEGMFGDLAGSLTARKNAEEGEKVDASLYDYDGVYDAMKPQKKKKDAAAEEEERRPKYMTGLLAASALRKRDQQIAEEKKIAREREAEGEEFADKEKFVTAAYKRQQEENKRLQEEERRREEAEAKGNKTGGMTTFYRDLLNRGEKERAEIVKATEEKARSGKAGEDEEEQEKTEAELAKELGDKGVAVSVNEDGQIVDKRQLLKGGLNVVVKKPEPKKDASNNKSSSQRERDWNRNQGRGFVGSGSKRAMVERQSKMLEEQLAESLKRAREEEEAEKQATIEKLTKSKKTETDISSARERYLARKRQAEEEKRKGAATH